MTFGGPFSWAGQRYIERSVRGAPGHSTEEDSDASPHWSGLPSDSRGLSTLTDVMISGNEGAAPSD